MANQPLSMQEGLAEVLSTIGKMLAGPDSDQPFLMDMQHIVVAKIHQGTPDQSGQSGGNPQPDAGGGPPVAGPGGPPPGPGGPGQGGPPPGGPPGPPPPGANQLAGAPNPGGGMQRPAAPNPDELRRFLESRAGR